MGGADRRSLESGTGRGRARAKQGSRGAGDQGAAEGPADPEQGTAGSGRESQESGLQRVWGHRGLQDTGSPFPRHLKSISRVITSLGDAPRGPLPRTPAGSPHSGHSKGSTRPRKARICPDGQVLGLWIVEYFLYHPWF